jgi:hypothetical protein
MCNLYSVTKSQTAIVQASRAMRDTTGNLPPLPGIFPDYLAPVVRNAPDGVRELCMARWGMPCPPQFGGAPVTNIRNTKARTGDDGSRLPTAASCRGLAFASTPTPSRKRPRLGSLSRRIGRSRSSPVSGVRGTACAGRRQIQSKASTSCSRRADGNTYGGIRETSAHGGELRGGEDSDLSGWAHWRLPAAFL